MKHILPRPNLRALACKATPVIRIVTYFVSRSISTGFRNSLSQTFHFIFHICKVKVGYIFFPLLLWDQTGVTSMECTATHFCLERENKIGFHSLFLAALATLCLHPPCPWLWLWPKVEFKMMSGQFRSLKLKPGENSLVPLVFCVWRRRSTCWRFIDHFRKNPSRNRCSRKESYAGGVGVSKWQHSGRELGTGCAHLVTPATMILAYRCAPHMDCQIKLNTNIDMSII